MTAYLPSDIWVGKGNLLENLPYKTVTPFMAKAGNLLMELIKQEQDQDLPEEFWEDILVDWPTEDIACKWVEAVLLGVIFQIFLLRRDLSRCISPTNLYL